MDAFQREIEVELFGEMNEEPEIIKNSRALKHTITDFFFKRKSHIFLSQENIEKGAKRNYAFKYMLKENI